jgi:hypothetical protein
MMINIRELFVLKALILGVLITLSTETLSFFKILNSYSIKFFWGLIILLFIIVSIFLKNFFFKIYHFKKNINLLNFQIIFIFIIFSLTFLNSIVYPPNTIDAMSYHMTRIMHWMQNNNVNIYPTNDFRQLVIGPLSEYFILHLYLFSNGDFLSNLVQWYAMVISCITVSLITKEFGCNYKLQIFSALFCATLPMGIMQSTSTQTDYFATMWIIIMAYFIIKYINFNLPRYIFAFSISLGLGILTKGTVYIFALPFCVWIGINLLTNNRKHFLYLFSIPLIVFILNVGQLNRNIILYNNPIGLSADNNVYTNQIVNLPSFTSNLIRNLGLNLAVPNQEINIKIANAIHLVHDYLNISSRDPNTTMTGSYFIPFSLYESTASNTLHFIIFLLVVFFIFLKKKFLILEKYYLFSTIAGFILLTLIMKWTPQHNRWLLSFFVLCSPIVGSSFFKLKSNKLIYVLALSLSLYSIPYILFNKSRPLLSEVKVENKEINFYKPFFFKQDRQELYYIADKFFYSRDLFNIHSDIVEEIKKANCYKIGFDVLSYSDMEYPLWLSLKKNIDNNNLKIFNINVKNKSASYATEEPKKELICAIISFDKEVRLVKLIHATSIK